MVAKIPKFLRKSPLVSVSCEVRFDSGEPYSDILATKIACDISGGKFPNVTRLPISQVPEIARSRDMLFEPILGFKVTDIDVLVGPNVVVARTSTYRGWDEFYKVISDVIDKINPVVKSVFRIGFRVVNFFGEKSIDDSLNIFIKSANDCGLSVMDNDGCSFAVTYAAGQYKARLSYANDATLVNNGKSLKKGSVVDVDSFCDNPDGKILGVVSDLHVLGKNVFFECLKASFIETMEPVYE